MDEVARFLIGGLVVSAFATVGGLFKPTSFAGLFGAAPSVALATLALTISKNGRPYASMECRSMIAGAAALCLYSILVSRLLSRFRISANCAGRIGRSDAMLAITLIGFSDNEADQTTTDLVADGYEVSQRRDAVALSPRTAAALVCADRDGWQQDLLDIRAGYPHLILIVVTRLAEHTIWLDALEAGANDYGCMPLDRRQLQWLSDCPLKVRRLVEPAMPSHQTAVPAHSVFQALSASALRE